jgi:hypothetical protein
MKPISIIFLQEAVELSGYGELPTISTQRHVGNEAKIATETKSCYETICVKTVITKVKMKLILKTFYFPLEY